MNRRLCSLLFLWTGVCFSFAPGSRAAIINAPDYYIQSFGIADGLPHEMTHHIVQDKTGFLWISTSGGLVRFDGYQFQTMTSPLLNNRESDLIYAICRGTNGSLWAAPNHGGLVEFNDRTKSFMQIASPDALPPNPPFLLKQTPDGAFWAGDFQAELRRWKNGKVQLLTNGLAMNQTISLATDSSNRIWIASDNLLARYQNGELERVPGFSGTKTRIVEGRNGEIWIATAESLQKIVNGQITMVSTNPPWTAIGGIPTTVLEDDRGTIWVGTRGNGLYRLENDNFSRVPTSHPWITDLYEDNENNVWATTHGGGIDRIRLKSFSNWNIQVGVAEDGIGSVCVNAHGDFWLADTINDQVVELPKGHHKREFQSPLLRNLRVACVDSKNQLWMATRSSLLKWPISLKFNPEVVFSGKSISLHALFCAGNDDVWAGGDNGFLGRYHKGQWQQFDDVGRTYAESTMRCLAEDGEGNLWIAMNTGDLLRYRDGQFTHFGTNDGLPGDAIHCILEDSAGLLWMATTREGLVVRREGKFYRVTIKQGIPDEIIDQMVEDDYGRIWFATSVGFYHVDRDELLQCALGKIPQVHPITYGRDVGLVGYAPVSGFQPTSCKSKDGLVVFTTHKGVISIDPAECKPNAKPPPVLVDEILVNDERISARRSIVLPHWARKIEFRVSAIEYSAPDQVKLRHWLEGFDSKWVDDGNQRSFTYPKLPPGKYSLRFSACNPDGVWNESVAPFTITVVPAWWQWRWVQIAGLMLAAGALTLIVRHWSHRRLKLKLERLEQKHAMEKERARIAKNLHDDLGGTLTEIGLLADLAGRNNNSPEKIKAAASFFSERVRSLARTLDTVVWTVNPKNDALDELATYLCGFSQELFSKTAIRCRLDVTGDIPPIALTPEQRSNLFLAAKEAMNNIIKHSNATDARLRIGMNGNDFQIWIEDNGHGFNPDAPGNSKRNGLANMRSRIEELNGTFTVNSIPGQGTSVSISIRFRPDGKTKQKNGDLSSNP